MNTLTPTLMVEDVQETVDWYERVFDAELVATLPPGEGSPWWAQVVLEDITIMFQERDNLAEKLPTLKDQEIGASVGFYIDVDDAYHLHDRLESAGVETTQDPHDTEYGRRQFAVEDCNGYVLWFSEKITNEPRGPIVR